MGKPGKTDPLPNTVTHTYRGSPKVIRQRFDFYVPRMEAAGYYVGNQSTIPGHRGGFSGLFIALLGLVTFGVGWLLFLIRPADTMIVVYQRWPEFMGLPEPAPGEVYRPQPANPHMYPMQPQQYN